MSGTPYRMDSNRSEAILGSATRRWRPKCCRILSNVGSNPCLKIPLKQKYPPRQVFCLSGTPYRIRTGVTAVRGRRPEPLDEGSIYCFVSIKLSFVEAGLTRRILRLALRANSLRSFVQNRSCDFVEPGYRVRGRRPEPPDEGSKGLILCPGLAGAAIIRSLSLFPSGICIE